MAVTVTMPQLGESVTEGTIQQWLKQPGDPVERYESIAEVNTDKVNAEIPSPVAGTMGEHLVEVGAVVPVGEPICRIEGAESGAEEGLTVAAEGAEPRDTVAAAPPPSVSREVAASSSRPAPAAPAASSPPEERAAVPAGAVTGRADSMHLTPAVRMLAREHAVDVTGITGSGLGGRVTKKDVLEFVQRRDAAARPAGGVAARRAEVGAAPAAQAAPVSAAAPASVTPPAVPAATGAAADAHLPLTPMRRAIAEHMSRSVQTSPHAWTMVEVDMTRVARVRAARREEFRARTGVDLTFLPFVAKAVIVALRQHPTLNATWTDEGVLLRRDINLGIAVALDDGLVVPVIRAADRLSMSGLAVAAQDLGDRARSNRLRLDDVEGGTFTLNNAGALGTVMSQAIINQPQAAILVMDAIVKRPIVVDDDAIAVRSMMNLCISFDHRINDGLPVARFLRTVKDTLESIEDAGADLW
jgi:2-oxoisovalerate dehydrogenase E2 component (dihydrolipoyl transacylase)